MILSTDPSSIAAGPIGRGFGTPDECQAMLDRLCTLIGRARQVVYRIRFEPAFGVDFVSACVEQVIGYSPAEFVADPTLIFRIVHPEDREQLAAMLGRPETIPGAPNIRWLHRDGRLVETECESLLLRDAEGRPIAVEGLIRDVTQARRTVASLNDVDARYRSLVEQTPAVVYLMGPHGELRYVSSKIVDLTGFSVDDWMSGRTRLADVLHPLDRERILKETSERQRTGMAWEGEYRLIAKDLRVVWVRNVRAPVLDEHGAPTCVQGLLVDVTATRHLEEQLREANKMEAIGRLAGGVAHDFNNLLTVIIGYADLLLDTLAPDAGGRADAVEIKNAAQSAARVTSQLLAISRRQVLAPEPLDLSRVIDGLSDILRRVLSEDIELVFDLSANLPLVEADQGQIERIMMNLAVNARDAMPSGGRLTVTTRAESDRHGRAVRLGIADTGCGIPDEVRAHMFEPFFTTKRVGKVTGLGLATVHGIVTQSGGTIAVESQVGKGTTFTVKLPAVVDATVAALTGSPKARAFEGSARILVVEDDDWVRKLTRRILEEAGFDVIDGDAETAIALVESGKAVVDALVTDIVMPGVSGPEVAERVSAVCPAAAIVFMSGHIDHPIVQERFDRPDVTVVHKPFTAESLIESVRIALEHRRK